YYWFIIDDFPFILEDKISNTQGGLPLNPSTPAILTPQSSNLVNLLQWYTVTVPFNIKTLTVSAGGKPLASTLVDPSQWKPTILPASIPPDSTLVDPFQWASVILFTNNEKMLDKRPAMPAASDPPDSTLMDPSQWKPVILPANDKTPAMPAASNLSASTLMDPSQWAPSILPANSEEMLDEERPATPAASDPSDSSLMNPFQWKPTILPANDKTLATPSSSLPVSTLVVSLQWAPLHPSGRHLKVTTLKVGLGSQGTGEGVVRDLDILHLPPNDEKMLDDKTLATSAPSKPPASTLAEPSSIFAHNNDKQMLNSSTTTYMGPPPEHQLVLLLTRGTCQFHCSTSAKFRQVVSTCTPHCTVDTHSPDAPIFANMKPQYLQHPFYIVATRQHTKEPSCRPPTNKGQSLPHVGRHTPSSTLGLLDCTLRNPACTNEGQFILPIHGQAASTLKHEPVLPLILLPLAAADESETSEIPPNHVFSLRQKTIRFVEDANVCTTEFSEHEIEKAPNATGKTKRIMSKVEFEEGTSDGGSDKEIVSKPPQPQRHLLLCAPPVQCRNVSEEELEEGASDPQRLQQCFQCFTDSRAPPAQWRNVIVEEVFEEEALDEKIDNVNSNDKGDNKGDDEGDDDSNSDDNGDDRPNHSPDDFWNTDDTPSKHWHTPSASLRSCSHSPGQQPNGPSEQMNQRRKRHERTNN
ncbi:hypothetical protein BDN71DRAFT_1432598, partial [Pleurotus eryngii]